MCLGIPGQIVDIVDAEQNLAKVDVSGVQRTISVSLIAGEGIAVDDWVLVHVGFALSKIDEAEAQMTLDQIKRLGSVYDEELEAFSETQIV